MTRPLFGAFIASLFGVLFFLLAIGCSGASAPSASPAASASGGGAATAAAEPLELRTYPLAGHHESALLTGLRRLLGDHGTVQLLAGNQLAVLASPGVHRGLADLLRQLETQSPAAPEKRTIRLTYWFVNGVPAAAAEPYSADLTETSPALDAIVTVDGTMRFTLLEKVVLQASEDDSATATGRLVRVTQRATQYGSSVQADLNLGIAAGPTLDTQVSLAAGQLLVLAQSGFSSPVAPASPAEGGVKSTATLYYLVRADVVGARQ
ncbi:MAG: hypothetical protein HYV63_25600 [Candidatus Schekmanbacteria bacterium]|nr:hypothetical protein [Candidatus Schekmanbacteria bacterium]